MAELGAGPHRSCDTADRERLRDNVPKETVSLYLAAASWSAVASLGATPLSRAEERSTTEAAFILPSTAVSPGQPLAPCPSATALHDAAASLTTTHITRATHPCRPVGPQCRVSGADAKSTDRQRHDLEPQPWRHRLHGASLQRVHAPHHAGQGLEVGMRQREDIDHLHQASSHENFFGRPHLVLSMNQQVADGQGLVAPFE